MMLNRLVVESGVAIRVVSSATILLSISLIFEKIN